MSSEAQKTVDLIKTRGYWEVDMRPVEPKENRFESYAECIGKVRDSIVKLRGWPYPVYLNEKPPYVMQGRIETSINFEIYKEFWTMFLSGHFYHLFSCREDWLKEAGIFGSGRYNNIQPGAILEFLMTLYSVTEIFEFATRLSQKNVFGKLVNMKIGLFGMEGRQIGTFDIRRWIPQGYICRGKNISFERTLNIETLIAKGHEIALDTVVNIFEMFNWMNVGKDVLREEQRKFLEKRL